MNKFEKVFGKDKNKNASFWLPDSVKDAINKTVDSISVNSLDISIISPGPPNNLSTIVKTILGFISNMAFPSKLPISNIPKIVNSGIDLINSS